MNTEQPQTSKQAPYSWVKRVEKTLLSLDSIPLLGEAPDFPWEALTQYFKEQFELDLSFSLSSWEWKEEEELLSNFGSPYQTLQIAAPPLDGSFYWVLSDAAISSLMSWTITKETSPLGVEEPEFQEGFFKFLTVELLHLFPKLPFDSSIYPAIQEPSTKPHGRFLCADLTISYKGASIRSRLLLSPEMQHSWKVKHTPAKPTKFTPALAEQVDVTLHVELGKVALTIKEWEKTNPGDFIILDTCSYDPIEHKGRLMLTINQNIVLRTRLKKGKLKILEFPLHSEDEVYMDNKDGENEELEDSLEDDILNDDDDLLMDDDDDLLNDDDDDLTDDFLDDDDDDLTDELTDELTEEDSSEEASAELIEEETDELTDELTEEDSSEDATEELTEDSTEETTEEDLEKEAEDGENIKTEPGLVRPHAKISNIPMTIVIEAGRIKMPAEQLLKLQPGNLLEINTLPENGVDIVVNQRRIGRGELLKMGETLGIRVLEMG